MLEASADAIEITIKILLSVLDSERQREIEIKKMEEMKAMKEEYKRNLRETVNELARKKLNELNELKKKAEEQAAEPADICVNEFKKFGRKQRRTRWQKMRDMCRRIF